MEKTLVSMIQNSTFSSVPLSIYLLLYQNLYGSQVSVWSQCDRSL